MPVFAELKAPDPSAIGVSLRRTFELRTLFHDVRLPSSDGTARMLLAYLVIVDKAVREYSVGRHQLQAHAASGGIQPYVEGLGHFENCINSVKRALRLLRRLGTKEDAPRFDRALRKLALVHSNTVTAVRDSIEHIDDDIVAPRGLRQGDPHLLAMDEAGESLRVGDRALSLRQLHETLSALFRTGTEMIHALPDSASADA